MFCPQCGKTSAEGTQFCGACGARLGAGAAKPAGGIGVPWGFILAALIGHGLFFLIQLITTFSNREYYYGDTKRLHMLIQCLGILSFVAVIVLIEVVLVKHLTPKLDLLGIASAIALPLLMLGVILEVIPSNSFLQSSLTLGLLAFAILFFFECNAKKHLGFPGISALVAAGASGLELLVLFVAVVAESRSAFDVYRVFGLLTLAAFGIFLLALVIQQKQTVTA